MDEGMGVPGGAVEQIFGSHPTSALLIQPSELLRCTDFDPGPLARPPPHKTPSGFRQSDASFAKNLLGATPAEAVRFNSCRICSRIVRATSVAVGKPVLFSVTSR